MTDLRPSVELQYAGGITDSAAREPSLVQVATLVLWVSCGVVGTLGFALRYAAVRPHVQPEPPAVTAQRISVELKQEPTRAAPLPARLSEPIPAPSAVPFLFKPSIPVMLALAEPEPKIALAVPMEAPASIVPAVEASYRTPQVAALPELEAKSGEAAPTPEPLTFGRGAGQQPAPNYPREALRAGQEGTVLVRFTVGVSGRVLEAEAISRSPWPLLNEAAVRAVRERWRFPAGPVRAYEVPIHFQIKR